MRGSRLKTKRYKEKKEIKRTIQLNVTFFNNQIGGKHDCLVRKAFTNFEQILETKY